MKKATAACSLVAVLGLGVGCGGDGGGGIDEGPSAMEGTANATVMASTAVQADTMRSAVEGGNGDGVASAAIGLSSAAMGAVTPRTGARAELEVAAQAQTIVNAETGTTGNKNCTPTGCTFDKYGSNGFTISGSVTATDAGMGVKNVVWNLTGSGDGSTVGGTGGFTGLKFTYTWKGDLTVSATSLAGAAGAVWKGTASANGQNVSFDYGSLIKFNSVVLASGCATGGSVFAKWWINAQSGGQSQAQAYQATQTFNGCQR